MKIKTSDLQAISAKVGKGVGGNSLIPITNLVGVSARGGEVTLCSNDGVNTVVCSAKADGDDEFSACVNAQTFLSLIAKQTAAELELSFGGKFLAIRGNGNYKLDVVYDGDSPLAFPAPEQVDFGGAAKIKLADFQSAVSLCGPSVSKNSDYPVLTGVYFGKRAIASDNASVCEVPFELVDGGEFLFHYSTLKLLSILKGESVSFAFDGENFGLTDGAASVFGKFLGGAKSFPADKVGKLFSIPMDSAEANVSELNATLGRMNIFTSQYDVNMARLRFGDCSLSISNDSSSAVEEVKLDGQSDAGREFECYIDLSVLQADLAVCSDDKVKIDYGSDRIVRLHQKNADFVIGLLQKEGD